MGEHSDEERLNHLQLLIDQGTDVHIYRVYDTEDRSEDHRNIRQALDDAIDRAHAKPPDQMLDPKPATAGSVATPLKKP